MQRDGHTEHRTELKQYNTARHSSDYKHLLETRNLRGVYCGNNVLVMPLKGARKSPHEPTVGRLLSDQLALLSWVCVTRSGQVAWHLPDGLTFQERQLGASEAKCRVQDPKHLNKARIEPYRLPGLGPYQIPDSKVFAKRERKKKDIISSLIR